MKSPVGFRWQHRGTQVYKSFLVGMNLKNKIKIKHRQIIKGGQFRCIDTVHGINNQSLRHSLITQLSGREKREKSIMESHSLFYFDGFGL